MSTDHYTVPCITLIGDSSIDHFQGVFYLAGRSCDYLFKYPFIVDFVLPLKITMCRQLKLKQVSSIMSVYDDKKPVFLNTNYKGG